MPGALCLSFLCAVSVFLPGIFFLRALERRTKFSHEGFFLRASLSFFLGLLPVLLFSLADALLAPGFFTVLSRSQLLFLLGIGLVGWLREGRPMPGPFSVESAFGSASIFGWAVLASLLVAGASALYVLSASGYPGMLSGNFGDAPSWYRVAASMGSGHFPWDDIWIADYGGSYRIPELFPFPSAWIAWQAALVGTPAYALETISLIFGLLGLGLFAELARGAAVERAGLLLAGLSPLLFLFEPAGAQLFSVTHLSLAVCSGLLLLLALKGSLVPSFFVLVLLLGWHPLLLLVLPPLALAFILERVIGLVAPGAGRAFQAAGFIVVTVLVSVILLLGFAAVAPARFSIFPYLQWQGGGVASVFRSWPGFSLELSRLSLGLGSGLSEGAERGTAAVLRHPAAFTSFFFGQLFQNLEGGAAWLAAFAGCLARYVRLRDGSALRFFAASFFFLVLLQSTVLFFPYRHHFPMLVLTTLPLALELASGFGGVFRIRWASAFAGGLALWLGASGVLNNIALYEQLFFQRRELQHILAETKEAIAMELEREPALAARPVATNVPKYVSLLFPGAVVGTSFLGTRAELDQAVAAKWRPGLLVFLQQNGFRLEKPKYP